MVGSNQLLENRYRVIKNLSSGGFGDTFIAEDTQMPSGRRCVIKRLKPVNDNPKVYTLIKERFQKEAATLEDLGHHHPQIPNLYAFFESDNYFYLVQEWVDGETLTQLVKQRGTLPEAEVKQILIKLLPTLEYIEGKRIIHRDIKPDNIIVRRGDEMPVLIDFGAVRETMGTELTNSGNTTSSIVIGTPGFMPSEQMAGRPVYSSDLYALGLTAIYLLTGKIPQELPSNPQTGEIIWQSYAPGVSPTLSNVLNKSIQSYAGDRYPTARQMYEAVLGQPTMPDMTVTPGVPGVNYSTPNGMANSSLPTAYPPEANVAATQVSGPPPGFNQQPYSGPISNNHQGFNPWLAVGGLILFGAIGAGGYFAYDQYQEQQAEIERIELAKQEAEAQAAAEARKAAEVQAAQERLAREKEAKIKQMEEQVNRAMAEANKRNSQNASSNNGQVSSSQGSDLDRQEVCGDPVDPSVSKWYAVVGNQSALSKARHYCADAFVAKSGNVQVASFATRDSAQAFADKLSRNTGSEFWVK